MIEHNAEVCKYYEARPLIITQGWKCPRCRKWYWVDFTIYSVLILVIVLSLLV